jgi:hypothetical protein
MALSTDFVDTGYQNQTNIVINAMTCDQDVVQETDQRLKTIFSDMCADTIHYHSIEPSPQPKFEKNEPHQRIKSFLHQLNHKLEQTAKHWKSEIKSDSNHHWHVFFDMEPIHRIGRMISHQMEIGFLGMGEGTAALCQANQIAMRTRSIQRMCHHINLAFWPKKASSFWNADLEKVLLFHCFEADAREVVCEAEFDHIDYVCGKILEMIIHLVNPEKERIQKVYSSGQLKPFDHPLIKTRWVNNNSSSTFSE